MFAPRSVRLAPLGFLALFKLRLLWHYLLFFKLTRKPSIDEGLSVGPFPLRPGYGFPVGAVMICLLGPGCTSSIFHKFTKDCGQLLDDFGVLAM